MRYLFCSLASPGYLYPAIRLALELQEHGHETLFVTDASSHLERAGLNRAPWREAVCFDPSRWFDSDLIEQQYAYLNAGIDHFVPNVIVADQLALSAFVAAREHQLPLAIIGFAAPIFPVSAAHAADRTYRSNKHLSWRFEKLRETFVAVTRILGLPMLDGHPDSHPYLGDIHLLRSVPELEGNMALLPPQVQLAGHLLWDPASSDPHLASFIERAKDHATPILYVQPGRSFGKSTFLEQLLRAVDQRFRLVIDAYRADDLPPELLTNDFVYVSEHLPFHLALPHVSAVVANGHTTSVLGALAHGLPMLLFPNGSGTEDISERCERSGAAIVLDPDAPASKVRVSLTALLDNPDFAENATRIAQAFDRAERTLQTVLTLEQAVVRA